MCKGRRVGGSGVGGIIGARLMFDALLSECGTGWHINVGEGAVVSVVRAWCENVCEATIRVGGMAGVLCAVVVAVVLLQGSGNGSEVDRERRGQEKAR